MDRPLIDLRKIAEEPVETARVEARLAGELDENAVPLWGPEFSASGGGKTPTPPSAAPSK
jgi:hypothetical protein